MHFLKRAMLRDMPRFLLIAVAAISVFLFVLFRRISAVLMPLCIVILSILSTFGLMAVTGVPFKLPTQILPSFLLAVGVGDSVHILVIFFQHFNRHGNKKDALAYALSHSGLAVLMTSVTTAGGLLSFSTAAVDPIANLGIFASIGVMLAFVFTVIFLPALIAIFPIKPASVHKSDASRESSTSNRLLTFIAKISINHPYRVLVTAVVIVGISIHGITMVKVSHDPVRWLPATSAVRVATDKINEELKGSINLEVVIDTGRENGLYDPEILNELEKSVSGLQQQLNSLQSSQSSEDES
jgi:predicted RND superfamily exporter protein